MGRMGLTEYLWYAYGPLEGRTAYCTAYSTDRKLLGGKWWKAAVELGGLM